MAINKVYYGNELIMDISVNNDVSKENLLRGKKGFDKNGEAVTGECDYDYQTTLESTEADKAITSDTVLSGQIGFVNKARVVGSMPNKGTFAGELDGDTTLNLSPGYYGAGSKVSLSAAELAVLKPENIADGVTILGVEGEYKGEEKVKPAGTVLTAYTNQDVVYAPADFGDYTAFKSVTVSKITKTETPTSGTTGITVTIGSVKS